MSSAFLDEDSEHLEELPELPQSNNPGYITPRGFANLQEELHRLEDVEGPPLLAAIEEGGPDAVQYEVKRARLEQRMKYLHARISRAVIVDPSQTVPDHVHFGAIVTTRDQHGHEMRLQIVGEDETDPEHNKVSIFSPLAKALMMKKIGEKGVWHRPIGDLELTVLTVEQENEGERGRMEEGVTGSGGEG